MEQKEKITETHTRLPVGVPEWFLSLSCPQNLGNQAFRMYKQEIQSLE